VRVGQRLGHADDDRQELEARLDRLRLGDGVGERAAPMERDRARGRSSFLKVTAGR
jgi:hypothetical protein